MNRTKFLTSTALDVQGDRPDIDGLQQFLSIISPRPPALASAIVATDELQNQIRELRGLVENWDGYGALPIGQAALDGALTLATSASLLSAGLGAPDVSPSSNGTVTLEWESPRGEAFAEVGNSEMSAFIRRPRAPTYYMRGAAIDLTVTLPALMNAVLSQFTTTAVGTSTQLQFTDEHDDSGTIGR